MAEQPPPDQQLVDALVAAALAVHGPQLDDEGRARLRGQTERLRQSVAALDAYHLDNSDEPDASFRTVDALDRL